MSRMQLTLWVLEETSWKYDMLICKLFLDCYDLQLSSVKLDQQHCNVESVSNKWLVVLESGLCFLERGGVGGMTGSVKYLWSWESNSETEVDLINNSSKETIDTILLEMYRLILIDIKACSR